MSGFFGKLFGSKEKGKEKKEEKKKKPPNEFAEDEKTFDGVVRQLKSDLYKDDILGSPKKKK